MIGSDTLSQYYYPKSHDTTTLRAQTSVYRGLIATLRSYGQYYSLRNYTKKSHMNSFISTLFSSSGNVIKLCGLYEMQGVFINVEYRDDSKSFACMIPTNSRLGFSSLISVLMLMNLFQWQIFISQV